MFFFKRKTEFLNFRIKKRKYTKVLKKVITNSSAPATRVARLRVTK